MIISQFFTKTAPKQKNSNHAADDRPKRCIGLGGEDWVRGRDAEPENVEELFLVGSGFSASTR